MASVVRCCLITNTVIELDYKTVQKPSSQLPPAYFFAANAEKYRSPFVFHAVLSRDLEAGKLKAPLDLKSKRQVVLLPLKANGTSARGRLPRGEADAYLKPWRFRKGRCGGLMCREDVRAVADEKRKRD